MDFNEHVGLIDLGMREGAYVMELELGESHWNRFGHAHGGALFTLLDTTMSRAFFDTLPPERSTGVTLEMKINYLKPVKAGRLTAYGFLIHATRRTAYVEGRIENAAGELVAKATATMYLTSTDGC